MNIPRSLLCFIPLLLLSNAGCGGSTPSAPTPVSPTATVTASATGGLQGASSFGFTVQTANFETGALTYRWEFGDGETSADAAPAHVYNSSGPHTVAVTVSNARQSVRAETSVTVHGLTGRWVTPNGVITMELTQSGTAINGQASHQFTPSEVYSQCVISGSVQAGTPSVILLSQPPCSHPRFPSLVPYDYRLSMVVGGQILSGTISSPSVAGGTSQITLNRQSNATASAPRPS